MALRESIARRAHSSVERKVARAGGRSASSATRGSKGTPSRDGPSREWSGDRRASSVIGLVVERPAGRETDPPARNPRRASVRRSGRATAREPGRAHGRPGRRAAKYPSSSGGPDTTPGSSRQQRDHGPHQKPSTRTTRAPTDAPTPPRSRPSTRLSPPDPPPSRHLDSPSSLLTTSSPAHLMPDPRSLPPPRLRPLQLPALGWPVQVLPGRSRKGSPARSSGLPFLQSPGGKPRKHPKAGRRPVALMGEIHRAKQMEGNTRRETGCPAGFSSLFPGASLGRLDSLHEPMGGRSRAGGRLGARAAIWEGGLPQRASDTPPERRECSSHGGAALSAVRDP
jgi:hypothetical protein